MDNSYELSGLGLEPEARLMGDYPMIKAAVMGATGYTGLELVRILAGHPDVEIASLTSRTYAGKRYHEVYPALQGIVETEITGPSPSGIAGDADVVFTALPHETAMGVVPLLLEGGSRVVDLSADFRFRSREVYEEWYQPHTAPRLLEEAVYGLPALYGESIGSARLVANPGCYPTSVILALAPLLTGGLIDHATIISDSKSGVF